MLPAATSCRTSMCISPNPNPNPDQQSILVRSAKPKTLLQKHPLYETTHTNISFQFKEKILCLEIMGVDSGRALAVNPALHSASLHGIHAIVTFLQSKGIHLKDLGRIFGMCPTILTSDIRSDLAPVFAFLSRDLSVSDHNFRRVINKCPRLLVSSVRDQLKPALFYLQRLGFTDLHALAYQDPILLVSSVENTLIPKLNYFVGLGFSRSDAVEMVLRCPALFTFSIENNFKPKLEYFSKEMDGKLEELKEFPQYFAFSLENRIKPRHMEVVRSGVKVALPLMLKATDEEFREVLMRKRVPKIAKYLAMRSGKLESARASVTLASRCQARFAPECSCPSVDDPPSVPRGATSLPNVQRLKTISQAQELIKLLMVMNSNLIW